eukprot:SAG22_NODE_425_length_10628_cov_3.420458_6_plen_75_part_00
MMWALVTTTRRPASSVIRPEAESVVVPLSKSEKDWSLRLSPFGSGPSSRTITAWAMDSSIFVGVFKIPLLVVLR